MTILRSNKTLYQSVAAQARAFAQSLSCFSFLLCGGFLRL